MTEEEKNYVNNIILDALTVPKKEHEGQQVINLDELDLCAIDYTIPDITPSAVRKTDTEVLQEVLSNEDIIKLLATPAENIPELSSLIKVESNAIIEFADAHVQDPEPVIYNISLQPGDPVTDDTIIGHVMQKGEMKNIKSIFSAGTVKSINNNTDYFRLYPSSCNRHIVLENTEIGNGSEYDMQNQLLDLSDKFQKEGELFTLITNNMCESLLPFILSRRYRGTYTRDTIMNGDAISYGQWYVDSSDISVDNLQINYLKDGNWKSNNKVDSSLIIQDSYNESLHNGITIFDSSVINAIEPIRSAFIADVISDTVDAETAQNWSRRAKRKKERKRVKNEINEHITKAVDKLKQSPNPSKEINECSDRILSARETYINSIIEIYENKESLPLCKFDRNYTDCQFLTSDTIDPTIFEDVRSTDEDFAYTSLIESDKYFNYYFSLLGNISLYGSSSNTYIQEYYNILTNIINKRLTVEQHDIIQVTKSFMELFNKNICKIFNLYPDDSLNTHSYLLNQLNSFEQQVKLYMLNQKDIISNDIINQLGDINIDDEIQENINGIYSETNKYNQIFNYIKNLYETNHKGDIEYDNTIAQLTTMYTYIIKYDSNAITGYGPDEPASTYFLLVKEEAEILNNFWDKVIREYKECTLNNCIDGIHEICDTFDSYAEWPEPTELNINDTIYQHYLFQNIYKNEESEEEDDVIDTESYEFPEEVEFPEIPDMIEVDSDWVKDQLENGEPEVTENPPGITFTDTKYWQKYFTLATLICLPPTFWNCGLDIMPYIQNVSMPCIFIAFKCVNITMFQLVVVFGLSIRGMYVWPVILYINTSDQPANLITPLITVLNKIRAIAQKEINAIEGNPITTIVNNYINKLSAEINELKKENRRLDMYKDIIKCVHVPNFAETQLEFAKIIDPSIDTRQRLIRLETLAQKQMAH